MPYTQSDLLNTVLASPIDGVHLQHILDEFLEREEYIHCHDQHGKTLIDNLMSRGVGFLAISIRKYEVALEEKRKNRISDRLFQAVVDGDLTFIQSYPDLTTLSPSSISYLLGIAIQRNHDHIVHYFVENYHADVNSLGPNGELPLFLAANAGNLKCMRYLIARGADHTRQGMGLSKTVLHESIRDQPDSLAIVNYLVTELNFDINERNYDGGTALHIAASDALANIVRGLLALRVNTEIKNLSGQTAADISSQKYQSPFMPSYNLDLINQNRRSILEIIREHEKEFKRRDQILQALKAKHTSSINLANLHINDRDISQIVSIIQEFKYVVHLDLSGNELTSQGVKELQAILLSNTHVVKIILERNPASAESIQNLQRAINVDNRLLLLLQQYESQEFGNNFTNEFIFLHKQGAKLNHIEWDGWYLIHYASYYGNEKLLQHFLTQADCDISLTTSDGEQNNVLHLALLRDNENITEILKLLTQTGRNLFFSNKSNKTPLFIAAEKAILSSVTVLLDAGDDPNYQNPLGASPLKLAVKLRQPAILQLLLENGAVFDPKIKDEVDPPLNPENATDKELLDIISIYENNECAFFKAILSEDMAVLTQLVGQGINLQCHDEKKHTPLFIAVTKKKWQSAGLLLCEGAQLDETEAKENNLFEALSREERQELRKTLFSFFSRPQEAVIAYFVSRTQFANRRSSTLHNPGEIGKLYSQLYANPVFRPVMEVLEYATKLIDIIIDTSADHVKRADPTQEETTKGSCNFKNGKIYLGAKRDLLSLLGTLAHELTHMACQILYENDCNPYFSAENPQQQEYLKIWNKIKSIYEEDKSHYDPIIAPVFEYSEISQPSELIVRIPQIIIQYPNGEQILKQQVPELLKFYQEILLSEFRKYIDKRKEIHIESRATNISYRDFFRDQEPLSTTSKSTDSSSILPLIQHSFFAQSNSHENPMTQTGSSLTRRRSCGL